MSQRRERRLIALQLGLALAAVPVALTVEVVEWHLPLLFMLLALSIASDLTAVESPAAGMKLSGSFMSLLLAMVFLGGSVAAVIGVVTILVGWARWREPPSWLLSNIVTYAWFPLLGGIAFHEATSAFAVGTGDAGFYVLVFALFAAALVTNFMMLALFTRVITGRPIGEQTRTVFVPGIPSELPIALLAVGVAYLYAHIGLEAIALFGVVLFSFQTLLGKLFLAEARRMELEKRNEQLSGFHVEMLTILLRTLDLRDRMTARHSAAVARYARETAKAAGYSERDQELVHTAALLHDIGKFELSDRVLKGTSGLSEDEWQSIKNHPRCGADLIARVDGYGDVASIVLAHHERVDGLGYPGGLSGDDVPELARIVAIADAYDVMTARDSYRRPMTPADAAAELRREAGAQFDARLVEVFLGVVSEQGVLYRHGEDADFDDEVRRPKRFAPRSRTEDDPQPVA